MYSCTFAFRCASLLIRAATTSFALHSHRNQPSLHLSKTSSVFSSVAYPDSCAFALSQTSYSRVSSPSPMVRYSGRAPTSMNSQFSLVRFSSVAFAAVCASSVTHFLRQPGQSSILNEGLATYRRRRQRHSAVYGTWLPELFFLQYQTRTEERKKCRRSGYLKGERKSERLLCTAKLSRKFAWEQPS